MMTSNRGTSCEVFRLHCTLRNIDDLRATTRAGSIILLNYQCMHDSTISPLTFLFDGCSTCFVDIVMICRAGTRLATARSGRCIQTACASTASISHGLTFDSLRSHVRNTDYEGYAAIMHLPSHAREAGLALVSRVMLIQSTGGHPSFGAIIAAGI